MLHVLSRDNPNALQCVRDSPGMAGDSCLPDHTYIYMYRYGFSFSHMNGPMAPT